MLEDGHKLPADWHRGGDVKKVTRYNNCVKVSSSLLHPVKLWERVMQVSSQKNSHETRVAVYAVIRLTVGSDFIRR